MELKVHDLLKIRSVNDLIYDSPEPHWLKDAINRAPFVVVRRAHYNRNLIPVGIRGFYRNERFPAYVHVNNVMNVVTPEQIARERNWIMFENPIFSYLDKIKKEMDEISIPWGPTGSVGFELVSKVQTVTERSDIDMMIRYTLNLTYDFANDLISSFNKLPTPIDIQVETSAGSFSLQEYVHSKEEPILFKTKDGPVLMKINFIH